MSLESNDGVFRTRVRYAECDAHGELFAAACINFFSEAAAVALRGWDIPLSLQINKKGAEMKKTLLISALALAGCAQVPIQL